MSIGSDPRKTLVDLNVNGDFPCYTIKVTQYGVIYAYRRMLAGRSGSNCAMVMLLARGACRDGRVLIEKLYELLTYAMSQSSSDQISPIVLDEKMSSFDGMFDDKFRQIIPSTQEPHKDILEKEAFRLYDTDDDLIKILENPYQPTDNKKYNCIHIIPFAAMAHPSQNSNMFQISHPLENAYFLNLPLDVEEKDNKSYIGEREQFTLVYKKKGYIDETIGPLSASYDSDYYVLNAGIIKVKSAKECNIRFKREISFSIQDEMGNPVNKWESCIDLEWRSFSNAKATWNLEDGKHNLSIRADGFETIETTIDTSRGTNCPVTLKSVGLKHRVYLKPVKIKRENRNMNFKDVPVDVNFTSNTSFYRSYKKVLSYDDNHVPRFYVMRKNPVLLLAMASVVACLIGIATGWRIAPKGQGSENEQQLANMTGITDSLNHVIDSLKGVVANFPPNTTSLTEEEKIKKDVDYLNECAVWEKSKLQSKKYVEFYSFALENTKTLKDINWTSYEEITNSNWLKIYDCIKHYIESGNKKEWNGLDYNKKVKKVASEGKIDLTTVFVTASHSAGTSNNDIHMPE